MSYIRFFFIIPLMGCCLFSKGQNMAAYTDYKNYFYAFNDGMRTELEYLPIQSFKVGGNTLAWIDNNGDFKVFNKGRISLLSETSVSDYTATDYLVTYSTYKFLDVFDNGKVTELCQFAQNYVTSDSLVAFTDSRAFAFNVYYNREIIPLETGSDPPVLTFDAGDNVLAYINFLNEFKVFYRNKVTKLGTANGPLPYKAGKNILAYYTNYGFSVFYKGLVYDLEKFQPRSFFAGDDLVAYITTNQELKVVYNGKLKILTNFEPTFYKVVDSLVVYNDAQKFNVFYNGTVYTLENYIPKDYQVDFNTVVYLDLQGRLKTFHQGKTEFVTHSAIDHYTLYRDVIHYRLLNTDYIYYNSKVYTQ